jgi:hypothetical protein
LDVIKAFEDLKRLQAKAMLADVFCDTTTTEYIPQLD